MLPLLMRSLVLACSALALLLAACRNPSDSVPDAAVVSYLSGRLTVNPEVDSVRDYRGFEVLALGESAGSVDTLGRATTDSTGAFAMALDAPRRGVYSLLISRRGSVLNLAELVVAPGDSAVIEAQMPLAPGRILRVRSYENSAWAAYKNARAQYNESLMRLLRAGTYDEERVRTAVMQTSAILWSVRENFGGTLGAEMASADAVTMLDGWDDALLLARAGEVETTNPGLVDVVRAARRAEARVRGQEAALALVRDFEGRVSDPEIRAAIHSELTVAHMDSLERSAAVEAALSLRETYPSSPWAEWAQHAVYEIEQLQPGMKAPSFVLTSRSGGAVTLDRLKGKLVLLEFFRPDDELFLRQLEARARLYDAAAGRLAFVAVSVEPDTLLTDALYEGRYIPGTSVIAPLGLESKVAEAYNVHVLPTRVLIDAEGRIVRKFVGGDFTAIQEAVAAHLTASESPL